MGKPNFNKGDNIMKNLIQSLGLLWLTMLVATAAFGQTRVGSREFYSRNPSVRMYHQQAHPMDAQTPQPGPGDNFVAYLYTGDQNFAAGDTVRPRLVVVKSTDPFASNGVSVYGRLLMPGPSGEFDNNGSVTYIQVDNGNYGYYRGGFAGTETVSLYSFPITTEMVSGEYVFDFSIVSAETGTLIQQVFARFFVNHTGPFGKGLYTLDGVTTLSANGGSYVTLNGNFPPSSTVEVLAGTPMYQWMQGPMQTDQTGHFVTFGVPAIAPSGYQGPVQSEDVIMHFPQLRESVTLHNAFAVQAQILTALPVSQ